MTRKIRQNRHWKSSIILTILALSLIVAVSSSTQTVSATTSKSQRIYNSMAGHSIWNSLTISNNTGYVGTEDGLVYAINLATNQLLWGPISTGDEFCDSPTINNAIVYLAGYHGTLYAFNAAPTDPQHQQLWAFNVTNALFGGPDHFYGSPIISDGLLYIAGMDGGFYVFAAGVTCPNAPLWSYQTDEDPAGNHLADSFESSPTLEDGIVYVSSLNGWVSAFNASPSVQVEPLWHIKLPDYFCDSPVVANGTIYLAGESGSIFAFPAVLPQNGVFWNRTFYDSFLGSPAVDNGIVYFAGSQGILYAMYADSNASIWSYSNGGHFYGSPVVSNGTVYIAGVNGTVYAFAGGYTRPNSPLWSYSTGDSFFSSPVIANNIVYAVGQSGLIHAFADNSEVKFTENGLMPGTSWSVTFDGDTKTSTNQSIFFSVFPNGQYPYSINVPDGYVAKSDISGTLNVSTQNYSVPINFIGSLKEIKITPNNASIVAGGSISFSAESFDSFGNDLGPVAATFAISSGANGSVSGNMISATKPGSWQVTASFPGTNGATATLLVTAGPLDHIIVSSSAGGIVAGGSKAFYVEGFDVSGNSLGAVDAAFSVSSGAGGTVVGNIVSATNVGSWIVTASFPGVNDATGTLIVIAGSLNHMNVTLSTNSLVAGASVTYSVEGFDAFGNSLGPIAASFSIPPGQVDQLIKIRFPSPKRALGLSRLLSRE